MSTPVGAAAELWLTWKRAFEAVRAPIVAEVTAGSDLSEPELSVLVTLFEAGGAARQNVLAAELGWDRTRLSHLITRMEAREYVTRGKVTGGVEVALLTRGKDALGTSIPTLEEAARRHLLDALGPEDVEALQRIVRRLLAP
jgi:DNA-binding MarR family transcriptional regulator